MCEMQHCYGATRRAGDTNRNSQSPARGVGIVSCGQWARAESCLAEMGQRKGTCDREFDVALDRYTVIYLARSLLMDIKLCSQLRLQLQHATDWVA